MENNNLHSWWTYDEVQTLLECVKTRKKYEKGIDWECIKEQYDNIRKIFLSRFPKEETQDFSYDETEFTKDRIASKVKQI